MNAPVKPEAATESTELVALVTANPVMVLTDPEKFDAFYERVKAETDAFVPDLSTDTSRKQIAAMAFKVTKTKTAIDGARKKLTEDARKQVDQVNAAGRVIWERLEALAAEVRKPLTEWETAEEARIADCHATIARLKQAGVLVLADTSETAGERLAEMEAIGLDEAHFQDLTPLAQTVLEASRMALRAAVERLTQEEADRAELERLRAEAAERERVEEERRGKAAYAQSIIDHIHEVGRGFIGGQTYPYGILLRELEEKIVIDDSFGDRAAEARQVLADTLASVNAAMERQAEEADRREREAEERDRQAVLTQARAVEETAQARREAEAARAETERLQAEQQQREADAATAAARQRVEDDAARAREEDRAHRSKFMGEAKKALMALGITEAPAKAIVNAIVAGAIPHVSLKF